MKQFAMAGALLFLLCAGAAAQNGAPMGSSHPESGCAPDLQKFCSKVQPGGGRKIACLHAHEKQLTASCRALLPSMRPPGAPQAPPK